MAARVNLYVVALLRLLRMAFGPSRSIEFAAWVLWRLASLVHVQRN